MKNSLLVKLLIYKDNEIYYEKVNYSSTLKENPSEASINSHRLMLRAGMIRQSSSGIYLIATRL